MEKENTIKILLVDDEVKFLKAVSDRLCLKGFDVFTATSGEAAIDAARKGGFDVAVVDLQMPETDGAQVLRILKQSHQYIEIIMLTGHATVDSAVECTRLGAFRYLEKPYDFDKLVDVLKDAYQARLQKKFESNLKRMEAIQKLSQQQSPLGLLREMARLDDGRK
ncbi:response regulator [Desulfosarcina alkanivorans]|uniref:Response regulator n=1 Tax=Desulfosarcina alkanivorans TaxID=571177 RepID=A0A5K7YQ18_9BACT|nr:response regulator [Desulfosarcina alkanivorans]BBO71852.1 response regulator [Desulfosarcina alkanivorans]